MTLKPTYPRHVMKCEHWCDMSTNDCSYCEHHLSYVGTMTTCSHGTCDIYQYTTNTRAWVCKYGNGLYDYVTYDIPDYPTPGVGLMTVLQLIDSHAV